MGTSNEKRYTATKYSAYLLTDKKIIESKIQFSGVRMTGLQYKLTLTLDFTDKPNEFKIVNEFDLKTEN